MQGSSEENAHNHIRSGAKSLAVKTAAKFLKKNPKVIAFIISSCSTLLLILIVFGTGMAAAVQLGRFLSDAWQSVTSIFTAEDEYTLEEKEQWMADLDAKELIEYIENGTLVYDRSINKLMKMNKGTFLYMLELCSDYEEEKNKERTITIEYISEERVYEYVLTGQDEYGNPLYEKQPTDETEEVTRKKDVVISNEHIESFKEMDWRFLYIFCLMRSNSYRPSYDAEIEEAEDNDTAWKITKSDVKKTFQILKTNMIYSYNVMEDNWLFDSFSLEKCKEVPHTIEIVYPEDSEDVMKETYYIPTSLLDYGYSGYSGIYHEITEEVATAIVEQYEQERYDALIDHIGTGYSDTLLYVLSKQVPGAESEVAEKFMYYKEQASHTDVIICEKPCYIFTSGYEVTEGETTPVFVPGSSGGTIRPDGVVYYKEPKTPGEAAVNYAVERIHWGYSMDKRMQDGWWDCSSLIGRSYYYGAGVDLNPGVTTLSLLSNALTYGQLIREEDMKPGDIWWFGDGISNGQYVNRHVVMYCGNGMAIQAYGDKYGTLYHSVKDMKASIKAKLQYCIRPYTGIGLR